MSLRAISLLLLLQTSQIGCRTDALTDQHVEAARWKTLYSHQQQTYRFTVGL